MHRRRRAQESAGEREERRRAQESVGEHRRRRAQESAGKRRRAQGSTGEHRRAQESAGEGKRAKSLKIWFWNLQKARPSQGFANFTIRKVLKIILLYETVSKFTLCNMRNGATIFIA